MPSAPSNAPALNRLFSPVGIAVGTLLGSLVAGVALLWFNYRVLGYTSLGNRMAAAGIVLYLMIILAASLLPNTPVISVAIMVGQCLLAWRGSELLQGPAIEYHRSRGGAFHSLALAGLVGLVTGLVAVMILVLVGRVFGLPIGIR